MPAATPSQWLPSNAPARLVLDTCRDVLETFGWRVFTCTDKEVPWLTAIRPSRPRDKDIARTPATTPLVVICGNPGTDPARDLDVEWKDVWYGVHRSAVTASTFESGFLEYVHSSEGGREGLDSFKSAVRLAVLKHRAKKRVQRRARR